MSTQLATFERSLDYGDAELAAMAEHIESRAWQDLVAAAPPWLRMSQQLIAEEANGTLFLASSGIPSLLFNRVLGLGERAPATAQQVLALLNRYAALGIAEYWLHVGPYAQPARLGQLLRQQGLKLHRHSWVKMIRPARRVVVEQGPVRVRRARAEDAQAVASIVGPAFDLPQCAAELFAHLIDRSCWVVYVAELHEQLIAAGGMYCDGDMVYLAFAATREPFRGHGAQRALMQAGINNATDAGFNWIAAEAGFPLASNAPIPSYHNLLGAGFRPIAIRDNYAPAAAE